MPKIITCTKRFPSVPFGHRQPDHEGHCRMIHGHNWTIEVEFIAKNLDKHGFVIDFGSLKTLKAKIDEFDHALVLNETDPALDHLVACLDTENLAMIRTVPDCSAEGLAKYFFDIFEYIINAHTMGRASVKRVTVFEDEKNSATVAVTI